MLAKDTWYIHTYAYVYIRGHVLRRARWLLCVHIHTLRTCIHLVSPPNTGSYPTILTELSSFKKQVKNLLSTAVLLCMSMYNIKQTDIRKTMTTWRGSRWDVCVHVCMHVYIHACVHKMQERIHLRVFPHAAAFRANIVSSLWYQRVFCRKFSTSCFLM